MPDNAVPEQADLLAYFGQDRFAAHVGIELLEVAPGRAKARLALQARHLNSHGTAHGGAIFALADFAFAAASNAHGTVAVAINVNIAYVKAAREGTLLAEACETSCGPRLATYTVEVTDAQGDRVALFQGMVYRRNEPLSKAAHD